jgi:hypothetical protein
MKKEIIESIVSNIVEDLDTNIKALAEIQDVLINTKNAINSIIGKGFKDESVKEIKYATISKKGGLKKGGISATKQTKDFLNKYMKSGEPFTMDTLYKRVNGLVPGVARVTVDNAAWNFKKENQVKFTPIVKDGLRMLTFASKDQ